MKGRVLKSTGSWYEVILDDGSTVMCRLKGKLRLEEHKASNPVAVGDMVSIDKEQQDHTISEILPRANHILRQSVKRTGHSQVLAANVDQVMVLATLKQPRTSLGFIDRVLVSAESFRIPQLIVFNKADLLDEEERQTVSGWAALYENIGVATIFGSVQNSADIEKIRKALSRKTTLITGHSGVGKSTMLNGLNPAAAQAVGDISSFSNKGTHTTTYAEMFSINANTFIIDTPGIKEWGLVEMEPPEISDYFPEMRPLRSDCRFGARCLHLQEPGCAVLKAVEEGKIALSRFESYISMVSGEDNRK